MDEISKMGTSVEQVQDWYHKNVDQLSKKYVKTSIRSLKPENNVEGKIIIELESQTSVGMITFWNRDVEVIRLDLPPDGDPVIIDDRKRSAAEDVKELLDSYLEQL